MQAVLHHHAETAFAEELGDMVVPRLGFDEEGLRTFSWDGGEIVAELGSDLKLAWSDSEGGKSWKTLPAFVPAAVKEDIKLLGKLLREAVKAQTARLEMALMLQRRWTIARWRELYEDHPLLRAFASGIVWGVHTDDGPPVRTFRRYHTGILADAGGREDELSENGAAIGMVHPLELDPDDIAAWQAHFDRLQLKPPFPQLQRPVERLHPLHANRPPDQPAPRRERQRRHDPRRRKDQGERRPARHPARPQRRRQAALRPPQRRRPRRPRHPRIRLHPRPIPRPHGRRPRQARLAALAASRRMSGAGCERGNLVCWL